jgi:hypothetical protein
LRRVRLESAPADLIRFPQLFAGDYLVAKLQALVADPRITGYCHSRDLVAALAAEAAMFCPGLSTHRFDGGDGRAGCPPGFSYHRLRAAHATVADVYAWPGDQLRDLLLAPPAEGARQKVSTKGHPPSVLMRLPLIGELPAKPSGTVRPESDQPERLTGPPAKRTLPKALLNGATLLTPYITGNV